MIGWAEPLAIVDRFAIARRIVHEAQPRRRRGRRIGATYQGFIKALMNQGVGLIDQVQAHLRRMILALAGRHATIRGWLAFTVDGTKIDLPRTRANERVFGAAGKARCGPQQLLTALMHMSTGLLWAWQIGPVRDSERSQLRRMISLLPARALLVADAGFTGYDLLSTLDQQGVGFLIRVGANVTLLSQLGYAVTQHRNTVYLWPHDRRKQPPLTLRVIRMRGKGGKPVTLVTNVLDAPQLSREDAAVLYQMRWGAEVAYRSLKQTLQRRKMRCAAPDRAAMELHGTLLSITLLGLMSTSEIIRRGKTPLSWSVACAVRRVRQSMRGQFRTARTLRQCLSRATKDAYVRKGSKQSRDYPQKKQSHPPGSPTVRRATETEIRHAARFNPQPSTT